MTDKYLIDSHKLIYHPGRVAQWMTAGDNWELNKKVYPIYLEVSPFGACNHRCVFCAVDFVGYQNRKLDHVIFRERLTEMARFNIKSIMFAGEGEPTLWKPLPEILDHCTEVGIDTSLTTNMVPFTVHNVDNFLRNCSWIKTSINAGTPETYEKIHRSNRGDFGRVMDNFRMAVEIRKSRGYQCTVGAQMVLLEENANEVSVLAEQLKAIGVDYLVVKPYSQHFSSITKNHEQVDYKKLNWVGDIAARLSDASFSVIYRDNTINKLYASDRAYQTCQATPFFWGYIMADGSVYGCSAFLGDERFCYGNIHESKFQDIWEGEKRKANYEFIRDKLDINDCRVNCRMDEINRYLWKLKHPMSHVNFI